METLKALGYDGVYGQYSASPGTFGALGLMAARFTSPAGADTWAFKTTPGTPVDNLTPNQIANITAHNGNSYIVIAGLNSTYDGRAADGSFIDVRRGKDALNNAIQVDVWQYLHDQDGKAPFDQPGLDAIGMVIQAALDRFTASTSQPTLFLSGDAGVKPKVVVPRLASLSPTDRKNRKVRSMTWSGMGTGAIQGVQVNGSVNF